MTIQAIVALFEERSTYFVPLSDAFFEDIISCMALKCSLQNGRKAKTMRGLALFGGSGLRRLTHTPYSKFTLSQSEIDRVYISNEN